MKRFPETLSHSEQQLSLYISENTKSNVSTICVVGFNNGLVVTLFMATNPQVSVYTFDFFQDENMNKIVKLLNVYYNDRLIDIVGNPIITIPEFARQFAFGYGKGVNNTPILERFPYVHRHPSWLRIGSGVKCDIVVIDGAFYGREALSHLRNFALLSHESTVIIYENVCSNCSNAQENIVRDRLRVWKQATRENLLQEPQCFERREWFWGFCMAKYTRPYIKMMTSTNDTMNSHSYLPIVDARTLRRVELQELRVALSKAAMHSADKVTVIIVPVTTQFRQLAINLWCNFQRLGIKNVLFWVLNYSLRDEIMTTNVPFYFNSKFSTTDDVVYYHEPYFNLMMRERLVLLQDVIELGFNFVFCDADIAFSRDFRSYVLHYAKKENCNIVVQTDTSSEETWVETNGGFYFVPANNLTLKIFQLLQQFLFANPEFEDQQAFGRYTKLPTTCVTGLDDVFLQHYIGGVHVGESCKMNSDAKICFLDPFLFAPGHVFFANPSYWASHARRKGITVPIMVHANGLRSPQAKEELLQQTGFWPTHRSFNCSAT